MTDRERAEFLVDYTLGLCALESDWIPLPAGKREEMITRTMMENKFQRLLADIERGYATGLKPVRGTFMQYDADGALCSGCGMMAAWVCSPAFATVKPCVAVGLLRRFAQQTYGLTQDEYDGFIAGFDQVGKEVYDLYENEVEPPEAYLAAYKVGEEAGKQWVGPRE